MLNARVDKARGLVAECRKIIGEKEWDSFLWLSYDKLFTVETCKVVFEAEASNVYNRIANQAE